MDKIPRRKKVEQLDRITLFTALMIHQISDIQRNVSVSGYEFIKKIIEDDAHLKRSIDAYKRINISELAQAVKDTFSYDQKLLIITNMIDLAYRHRERHEHEIDTLRLILPKIDFPLENFEDILFYSRAKLSLNLLNEDQ
jgi:uncharacterized tellurite resistance protein B-like protein